METKRGRPKKDATAPWDFMLRGSGRTHRAMQAAPRGCIYIVHSGSMARYVLDMCREMGRPDITPKVVAFVEDIEALRGLTKPVAIDHAFMELARVALIDALQAHVKSTGERK